MALMMGRDNLYDVTRCWSAMANRPGLWTESIKVCGRGLVQRKGLPGSSHDACGVSGASEGRGGWLSRSEQST